jgi:hypothetical protein
MPLLARSLTPLLSTVVISARMEKTCDKLRPLTGQWLVGVIHASAEPNLELSNVRIAGRLG